jgi:hypothetical protein
MKALQAFVDRENKFSAIFGQRPLNLNNAADRKRLAQKIDSALSPENLSCDGELSRTEVNRRFKEYTTVAKQLMALDPSVEIHEYY